MSYSSSTSLPALPTEVKTHILRSCDQATLAVTSRVSLAFLELSIPILHDNIHIQGLENMEKLFCSRAGSPSSALDGLLSVQNVRALTIASVDGATTPLPSVSLDRLAGRSSLAVSHLTLGLSYDWNARWDALTPVLDPETVRVYSIRPGPVKLVSLDIHSLPWHRLRSIEFSGCTPDLYLGAAEFFSRDEQTESGISLIVVYNLAERGWSTPLWDKILQDLVKRQPVCDMFRPASRLAGVVVRVKSELDRQKAVQAQAMRFQNVPETERTRRLALIRYEVTNPTVAADPAST